MTRRRARYRRRRKPRRGDRIKTRSRHRALRDDLYYVRREIKTSAEKLDAVLRSAGIAPERETLRPGRRFHPSEGRRAALRRGRALDPRMRARLAGRGDSARER